MKLSKALDTAKIDMKMNEIVNRVVKEKADKEVKERIENERKR
ncbi:hypothetical protein [Tetragenococcus koreensis]|nr:hypothetical protein [Tetragenococcus koreensis]